jgi:hypothetical protein
VDHPGHRPERRPAGGGQPCPGQGLLAAVRALLAAERGAAAWDEICSVVEGASESEVAEALLRLRAWPYRLRRMPDRWWAPRQAGEHRPWHRLATHRLLCWSAMEPDEGGVTMVACPDDLSLLLLGWGAEGNNPLGSTDLVVPNAEVDAAATGRCPDDDELPAWVATLDVEGMAAEAVWPWVAQVRLAPYSYDWIDNRGRRSPQELAGLPEPKVGRGSPPLAAASWARSSRSIRASS